MKGKLPFRIKNKHIEFKFEIERNITVITGDSGTGKTKLVQMVDNYATLGKSSGVSLTCQRPCVVLSGVNWETILDNTHESVVFADESSHFLKSHDFAKLIQNTDNYYVLVTRELLPQLPYSVDSIKRIDKFGSKPKLVKIYDKLSVKSISTFPYDVIIVEDSMSGFQFFQKVVESLPIDCVTANGKSGILPLIKKYRSKRLLVIADSAALGSEIRQLEFYRENSEDKIDFFLPECFEWMILKSGIFRSNENVHKILSSPADYIESKDFFSWERFFTHLLIEETKEKVNLQYNKSKIAPGYCTDANIKDILDVMNS